MSTGYLACDQFPGSPGGASQRQDVASGLSTLPAAWNLEQFSRMAPPFAGGARVVGSVLGAAHCTGQGLEPPLCRLLLLVSRPAITEADPVVGRRSSVTRAVL
jgi:hypothetical protein